ncbi:hypothetical protein LTR53_014696 [Teratosphaeriaceae sp. CCFEE 6253]|nr:hypothetical protein LTR53_014696 [Teratosphaeriaceae sp. CCFEE 6253]
MAFPITLSGLTPREAVLDALYRASLAFDTGSVALLHSALTPDAVFDLNGRVLTGIEAILAQSFAVVAKLDTTHFVTNPRVDLKDGGTEAAVTTGFLAQHYRLGTGGQGDAARYLVGGVYLVDLVRDEEGEGGLWRARRWVIKSTWSEGDRGVMTGEPEQQT